MIVLIRIYFVTVYDNMDCYYTGGYLLLSLRIYLFSNSFPLISSIESECGNNTNEKPISCPLKLFIKLHNHFKD